MSHTLSGMFQASCNARNSLSVLVPVTSVELSLLATKYCNHSIQFFFF